VPELFDDSRIVADLETIADNPGLISQYFHVLRSKFTSRREIDLINQWAERYKAVETFGRAKTGALRANIEYDGLNREKEEKEAQARATIAKHQADEQEHVARAAKAQAERRRMEALEHKTQQQAPLISPADSEQFDRYEGMRILDKRQEHFEAVFLPAMTAVELEKAFEKQKATIYRDRDLTEPQQDRLLALLTARFQEAMGRLEGSDDSIYES
jgi:hypothetical protein